VSFFEVLQGMLLQMEGVMVISFVGGLFGGNILL
jgi:hypothetical protein